jgi:inorganic triphosphatase YgiF
MEVELKLSLDSEAAARWKAQLLAQGAERQVLRAIYFDTDDSRLAAAGFSLRLRRENGRWVQTLKAPGKDAVERLEHEVALDTLADDTPALDLQRHHGTPAGAALADVRLGAASAMRQRFHTDVERWHLHVSTAAGTAIDVALDSGFVQASDHRLTIAELEVEWREGPRAGLFDLAADVLREGGARLAFESKAQRGERLAAGPALRAPTYAAPMALGKHADGHHLLQCVLRNTLAQVLPNADAIAEGSTDGDVVHQLRVGLRRTRTAIRELGRLAPGVLDGIDGPLTMAFRVLGQRRDDEVLVEAVRPLLAGSGAPRLEWASPPPPDLVQAVIDTGFQLAVLQLLRVANTLGEAPCERGPKATRRLVEERLDHLHRSVTRQGCRFDELPTDAQHSVRKQVKRLRYLSEFVGPLWQGREVKRYLACLEPVQEALGRHNDMAVATEKFRVDAVQNPQSWFAAGVLQVHGRLTSHEAKKALRLLERQRPFWLHD